MRDYYRGIDGLRAVAVLTVMLSHAEVPGVLGAYIGVDIFFVISGFLITSILLKEHRTSGAINIANFYIRRILRLIPALLVLITFVVAYAWLFTDTKSLISTIHDAAITLLYSQNWTWAFNLHSGGYLAHTWSLSLEEQFYILWPPLMVLALRFFSTPQKLITFLVFLIGIVSCNRILLTLTGASYHRMYLMLDTRADSLLVGALLSILASYKLFPSKEKLRTILTFPVGFSVFLYCFLIFCSHRDSFNYYYGFTLIAIASASVLLLLTEFPESLLSRILSDSRLRWIGKISYGLYLWHWPIYTILREKLNWRWYSLVSLGSVAVFFCATLSFYVVEKHFLQKKEKYSAPVDTVDPIHVDH